MSTAPTTPTTDRDAYLRYTQALRDMRLAIQRGDPDAAEKWARESLALEKQHPEFVIND